MILSKRNIAAYFLALTLIGLGKVARAKRRALNGEFILSIYFHNPSRKEFETIIAWLINQNFNFISLMELKMILKGEMEVPKGAVLVTVDDGWESNESNIVEIADKYKVPVAIFVSTKPVEEGVFWWSYVKAAKHTHPPHSINDLKKIPNKDRVTTIEKLKEKITVPREALTPGQLLNISRSEYITIGGHTHSHPILINCSDEELREELILCREKLKSWIGKDVDTFAYPNGDFGEREVELLKDLNYVLGFANNPKYLMRDMFDKPFHIPRFGFREGASNAENKCRMVGAWKFKKK